MADRDYRQELTQRIIDALEQGTAPWQKPWEAQALSGFMPFNPVSGTTYRGGNVFALALSGYEDPRWCTYRQASEKGWQVRKGERSTLIEFWKFHDDIEAVDQDTGEVSKTRVKRDRPMVRYANVFNVQQMDNVPQLARDQAAYAWDPIEEAERIVAQSGARLLHDQVDRAFYSPAADDIHMPPREAFPTAQRYYAVALHELGHWTGHESRLKREFGAVFGDEQYAREELRAELASFFLSAKLGIEFNLGNHASYVANWVKVLKEDKNEIFRAARDAEAIADHVIGLGKERSNEATLVEPPHLMTRAAFVAAARAEKLQNHGRQWEVFIGNRTCGFSDAPTAHDALRDAHRAAVHNALFFNEPANASLRGDVGLPGDVAVPPAAVLRDYPELRHVFPTVTGADWGDNASVTSRALPTSEVGKGARMLPLYVPFAEKDQAKALGAKWDKQGKRWYVPEGVDSAPFARWATPPRAVTETEIRNQFADALGEAGLVVKGEPIMDGKWHRTTASTSSDAKALKGAYIASLSEHVPNGYIKNHDTGVARPWFPRGLQLDAEQRARFEREAAESQKRRSAELAAEREAVAVAATRAWSKLPDATAHPYLERKGVEAFGVKSDGEQLVVPLRDAAGKVWNLQHIPADPQAEKMYMKGGLKTGRFHVIGELSAADIIVFAEGYATGASEHMATGLPVVVCFDSGNLGAVLAELSPRLEGKLKVIAGDDDALTAERIERHLRGRAEKEPRLGLGALAADELAKVGHETFALRSNESCVVDLHFVEGPQGIARLEGSVRNDEAGIRVQVQLLNAGREKAMEAAQEHNAIVTFPKFESMVDRPSDFNDLHRREGLDRVRAQLLATMRECGREMSTDAVVARALGDDAVIRSPEGNRGYVGRVVGNTQEHAVQDLGKNTAVTHELASLDRVPPVGAQSRIVYREGKGRVESGAGRGATHER